MLIRYLKSAPCHQETEYILLVAKSLLKNIMYTDIPHSIHSLCAIVACENVNPFFETFFKFSVFFFSKLPSSCFVRILPQFFCISDEIHVFYKKNCY